MGPRTWRTGAALTLGCMGVVGAAVGQNSYRVQLLEQLADTEYAEPLAINNQGRIVGRAWSETTQGWVAVRWDLDGTVVSMGVLGEDEQSEAVAISNTGTVAGSSWREELVASMPPRLVEMSSAVVAPAGMPWSLAGGGVTGGASLDLRTAAGVNDSGDLVGTGRAAGSGTGLRGWVLRGGVLTDLGEGLEPHAINGAGVVVGRRAAAAPFRWENGVLTDLPSVAASAPPGGAARGVNESGWIVGTAYTTGANEEAVLWRDGQAVALGTLGVRQSDAFAVNARGDVVGRAFGAEGPFGSQRAFVSFGGGAMEDLNNLVAPGSDWDHLTWATGVNDDGVIVGVGVWLGVAGQPFAMIPACACDADGDGELRVADIFGFLRAWFAGGDGADFDGENGVQVADIFAFLRCWFGGCR